MRPTTGVLTLRRLGVGPVWEEALEYVTFPWTLGSGMVPLAADGVGARHAIWWEPNGITREILKEIIGPIKMLENSMRFAKRHRDRIVS